MTFAIRRAALVGAALIAATACSGGKSPTGPSSVVTPPAGFTIDLRFVGPTPQPAVQQAFAQAKARWQQVVTGHLPDEVLTTGNNAIPANACIAGQPALQNTTLHDVVIFARVDSIDGPGQILGQAGPCYIRDNSTLALVGYMQFDRDDMAAMVGNGTIDEVILHEMGHVLGVGTLWDGDLSRAQTAAADTGWIRTTDVRYTGAAGNTAWVTLGGTSGAPIENCASGVASNCGSGTWLGHWREATFRNELMTGYISATGNPLSTVTIGALKDLGYTVNLAAADPYTLPSPASFSGVASHLVHLGNDTPDRPIFTLHHGTTRRVR